MGKKAAGGYSGRPKGGGRNSGKGGGAKGKGNNDGRRRGEEAPPIDYRPAASMVSYFECESDAVVNARKLDAQRPLERLGDDAPCVACVYPCPMETLPGEDREVIGPIDDQRDALPLPLPRPAWGGLSPEGLRVKEERFFADWVKGINEGHARSRLNFFEYNLEVWRQIWRTMDGADAFIIVLDARLPLFHFSVSLYRFLADRLEAEAGPGAGNVVLVINKVDMVPTELVDLWVRYFGARFPGLPVVPFWTPTSGSAIVRTTPCVANLLEALRGLRVAKQTPEGLQALPASSFFARREGEEGEGLALEEAAVNGGLGEERRFRQPGTLAVALIGDPNMGKSSVVNGLFGRKVCSSSSTPGHTKHFQTLFLPLSRVEGGADDEDKDAAVQSNVCFVDSPGIVVPKLDVPRAVQIAFGSYRIANVREPYSVLRWLMESGVGLVGRLSLDRYKDKDAERDEKWTPLGVCEAFARKRRFFTKKGALESHRAANFILRDVLNGRGIIACYLPPTVSAQLPAVSAAAAALQPCLAPSPEGSEAGGSGGEEEAGGEAGEVDESSEDDDEGEEVKKGGKGPPPKANAFSAFMSDSEDESEASES